MLSAPWEWIHYRGLKKCLVQSTQLHIEFEPRAFESHIWALPTYTN